jgi:hypothetical protein
MHGARPREFDWESYVWVCVGVSIIINRTAFKLVWQTWIQQLPEWGWVSAKSNTRLASSQGVGCPITGHDRHQSVSQIIFQHQATCTSSFEFNNQSINKKIFEQLLQAPFTTFSFASICNNSKQELIMNHLV